jgi:hypothetical protein
MHLDNVARGGFLTVSDDDVLDLKLIRRRLIGRHRDVRLFTHPHNTNLTDLHAQRRQRAAQRRAAGAGCDDSLMAAHWLKAVGHARGPLPARWIEAGRTGVLREGGFPRRPRVSEDDRLVLYASVWRRVFGVVVAVGEVYRVEHPRWPWRIAVEPLLVVPDLDLAPPVEAIGVAARSMSQQSHIRLELRHYTRAVEALSSIAL